ncbi:MAG TPA: hypothetical protein VHW23_14065, partial [Kofleriaceae bacterium]|nr:hypothetical protein [Kofleriaceae bacterium]
MASPRPVVIALPAVLLAALLATPARADDEPPMPPMAPPMPRPVYPAPLSQTTQSTYVPQSVALSGPGEIEDFDFSRPVPVGYTPVARARKHLIVGGAVTFGVVYGVSLLTAAAGQDAAGDGGRNEVAPLWIPVAGPFIQAGQTDSALGKLFLAGAGAAQLAGALMLYYGLTTQEHVLVRNDLLGSLTVAPL